MRFSIKQLGLTSDQINDFEALHQEYLTKCKDNQINPSKYSRFKINYIRSAFTLLSNKQQVIFLKARIAKKQKIKARKIEREATCKKKYAELNLNNTQLKQLVKLDGNHFKLIQTERKRRMEDMINNNLSGKIFSEVESKEDFLMSKVSSFLNKEQLKQFEVIILEDKNRQMEWEVDLLKSNPDYHYLDLNQQQAIHVYNREKVASDIFKEKIEKFEFNSLKRIYR